MRERLIRRIASGVGMVLVVVTLTFVLINVAPGDPARLWVGPAAGAAELEAARDVLGLDRPLAWRYLSWLRRFATFDWGTSLVQHREVTAIIGGALPHTLILTGASLLLTYAVGLTLGAFQAARARSGWDRATTVATLVVQGMPAYWLAVMLVLVFAYAASRFGWPAWLRFPAMGVTALDAEFLSPWHQIADRVRHLVLPLATLGAIGIAAIARFARGSILDVRHEPFVRAGRARGLSRLTIETRYVMRNALIPIVTLLGLSLPALFSGTVFVEVIFAWPGMGREIVAAVAGRDYPVVMATTAIFAVLVVAANGAADLLYAVIDPRIRR